MTLPLFALLPLLPILPGLPCSPPQIIGQAPPVLGPFVGNLTPTSASVWVRLDRRDPLHMALVDASGKSLKEQMTSPSLEQDKCVRWELQGLAPDTSYAVTVSGDRTFFKTPPDPDKPSKVVLAIGANADDRPGLPNPVWPAIRKCAPDALVLLGDTPYIEST